MAPAMCDLEMERARKIAENRRRMMEMGLTSAAANFNQAFTEPSKPKAEKRPRTYRADMLAGELRRSSRPRTEARVSYRVDGGDSDSGSDYDSSREDGEGGYRHRRRSAAAIAAETDPARIEELRARAEARGAKRAAPSDGPVRGPKDSGKGVRVQGGRVYDSAFGVTCHWCRQKTLEAKVTCTSPACGGSHKLPLSFCKMCLKNRHGEDVAEAEASGCWVCPRCRGSCGEGCAGCCNCGPCRKKRGQEPTGQLMPAARREGFTNVHDYLVHQATGHSPAQIAARKSKHAWGAFLDAAAAASAPAANAVEAAVEPSEGEADAPCAAHGHAHRHSHGRGKQAASPAAAPRSWSPSSSAAAAAGTPPKAPARATAEPLSPVAEPQAVTPTKKAAAAAAATKVPATPVKASPPGPATPVAGRLAARRRPLAAA